MACKQFNLSHVDDEAWLVDAYWHGIPEDAGVKVGREYFHTYTEALRWIECQIQISESEALDEEQDND